MAFRLLPNNIKQWKVVIIAFAVATTFWFFNSLNKDYTTSLNYPIKFIYNEDSLISVRSLPARIELDVTGGGWSLLRKETQFNPKPLEVFLENPVGMYYLSWVEMVPSFRDQMGEVNVNQVLQDTLRIQIEPLLQKKMKLWVDSTQIKLENNYRLVSSVTVPNDTITLFGPKSFIDSLGSTFELQISEESIDENFDDEILVIVPRPSLIRSEPSSVQTIFSVERFDQLQIDVPVETLNFPADSSFQLERETVTIHFTAQRSLQREYVSTDFGISADMNIVRSSDSTVLAMLLHFPEEIVDIEIKPKQIRIIPNE